MREYRSMNPSTTSSRISSQKRSFQPNLRATIWMNFNSSERVIPRAMYDIHLIQKHREDLKKMLVQHNIRVISKYYSELSLQRMSELVNAEKDFCEQELCALNNEKVISCRVDRISGVIDFKPIEHENNLLENWNTSINNILDMVDTVSNLINRER